MPFSPHENEVRNDTGQFPIQIQDPNTPTNIAAVIGDALKVTGGGGGFEVLDGATVAAGSDLGSIIAGKDTAGGTNQFIAVNSAGRLQVDVISGGTSGQQVIDNQVAIPATDAGNIAAGFDGTNYQFISVDTAGQLQVDVLTLPSLPQLPGALVGGRLDVNIGADLPISHSADNIRLGDGTTLTDVVTAGGGNRLMVETFPSSAPGSGQNVIITDGTTGDEANVDVSGRLQVSTPTPVPPPASTAVVQSVDGQLGNNAVFNSFFTITNGNTLTIQRFTAAGEGGANNGWFFELHEDPLGVGTSGGPIQPSWNLIELMVIPANGDSKFVDVAATSFSGDGTRRIVMRVRRLGGGGSKRGFMKFTGFEQ